MKRLKGATSHEMFVIEISSAWSALSDNGVHEVYRLRLPEMITDQRGSRTSPRINHRLPASARHLDCNRYSAHE
jgi:hypothetical protein